MNRQAAPQTAPPNLCAATNPLLAAMRAEGSHSALFLLEGAEVELRLQLEKKLAEPPQEAHAVWVRSPVAGRFYHAEAPHLPPAVTTGQQVGAGATLGYMEAMKLIHPLPSAHAGKVHEVLVENGACVVVGQALVVLHLEATGCCAAGGEALAQG